MTGCVIPRRGIYYVRLTYYDKNHQRKEKWVSTGLSGRGAKQKATAMILSINIETGNQAVDDFFKGNVQLINNFLMALAEEQIKAAFEQSEKEVNDLHTRISQGMREAKNKGAHIGLPKGTSLTTKKSFECKAIIQKHSKDFGGSLEDSDVIKLCGCSRNSYYKYKRELKG